MSEVEYSEELRALALRFFAFDDAFWVKRTETFMKLSSEMHDLREDINELLKVMRSTKPFRKIVSNSSYSYGNPVSNVTIHLNEYSMSVMFKSTFDKAHRLTSWGDRWNRWLPHSAALAWIEYFAEYDENTEKYVPGKNWVSYYNKNYRSQVTEPTEKE